MLINSSVQAIETAVFTNSFSMGMPQGSYADSSSMLIGVFQPLSHQAILRNLCSRPSNMSILAPFSSESKLPELQRPYAASLSLFFAAAQARLLSCFKIISPMWGEGWSLKV
jgi:hypothetical protein